MLVDAGLRFGNVLALEDEGHHGLDAGKFLRCGVSFIKRGEGIEEVAGIVAFLCGAPDSILQDLIPDQTTARVR